MRVPTWHRGANRRGYRIDPRSLVRSCFASGYTKPVATQNCTRRNKRPKTYENVDSGKSSNVLWLPDGR